VKICVDDRVRTDGYVVHADMKALSC
jgi:hypothetical protein